jgi:hypothetical protein
MRLNIPRLSKLFNRGGRWVMYMVIINISRGEVMSTLEPNLRYDHLLSPPEHSLSTNHGRGEMMECLLTNQGPCTMMLRIGAKRARKSSR